MEGRHCFGHLTIEENLLTGAFTRRDGKAAIKRDLELVYAYFPRLRERRSSLAGYTSGGEQQMCAIGRALMSRPKMILLDEPSMGLAPQIVEEIFEIVKDLNEKEGVSFLLAEQNTNMALQYRALRLHSGERPRGDGRRRQGACRERGRQGILPRHLRGPAQIVPRRQALQAGASGGWRKPCPDHYDALETRDPAAREREQFARLPDVIAHAMTAPGWAKHLRRRSEIGHLARGLGEAAGAAQVRYRGAAEGEPAVRRPQRHRAGQSAKRLLMSPGPIFEPEGEGDDWWGAARALFAAGFRDGDIVHNSFAYHLTPGGFILESGAHALGCAVIPGGVGNTEQQLEAIAHYKPTGYVGTPDFLKILLDTAEKTGKDASSIKRGLVSGAALPASLREELGRRGVAVLQCYATAETGRDRLRERGARRHDRQRERHRRNRAARHRRSGAGRRGRRGGRHLVQSAIIR